VAFICVKRTTALLRSRTNGRSRIVGQERAASAAVGVVVVVVVAAAAAAAVFAVSGRRQRRPETAKTAETALMGTKEEKGPASSFSSSFSLWETSQTLFWAIFGLIDLDNFELTGIKEFTRFSGLLMFGSFSVINIIVLLNLLIAMMNHSYQMISVSSVSAINLFVLSLKKAATAQLPFFT